MVPSLDLSVVRKESTAASQRAPLAVGSELDLQVHLKVYVPMAMRIGELAKRAGLATSALRYYEEAGLLPVPGRTPAGYRVYGQEALGRLEFIRRAQALGLSVGEIRRLIESPRADNEAERSALRHSLAHKLTEMQRRLRELGDLKSDLEALYVRLQRAPGPDCGHVGDCACWLPTDKEVRAMTEEVRSVQHCNCTDSTDPDCGCGCCTPGA
jgi:DNA-binding transcriptional MerR regulator